MLASIPGLVSDPFNYMSTHGAEFHTRRKSRYYLAERKNKYCADSNNDVTTSALSKVMCSLQCKERKKKSFYKIYLLERHKLIILTRYSSVIYI